MSRPATTRLAAVGTEMDEIRRLKLLLVTLDGYWQRARFSREDPERVRRLERYLVAAALRLQELSGRSPLT